jgi:hypothetical protein
VQASAEFDVGSNATEFFKTPTESDRADLQRGIAHRYAGSWIFISGQVGVPMPPDKGSVTFERQVRTTFEASAVRCSTSAPA